MFWNCQHLFSQIFKTILYNYNCTGPDRFWYVAVRHACMREPFVPESVGVPAHAEPGGVGKIAH